MRSAGVRNIGELKKAFARTNTRSHPVTDSSSASPLEPHKAAPSAAATAPPPAAAAAPPSAVAAAAAAAAQPRGIKTLASFVDVPKLRALPAKEIEALWRLRHAPVPGSLCAAVPAAAYRRMEAVARRHPHFVLPLARDGQGAEIHFLQWTFPAPDAATVLFTHLAEYKLRGEFAQPHTTVTHHLEMADDKGLVLLQGSVMDGRGVSVDDGRMLLMYLQKFYGMQEKEERARLLRQFNSGDAAFKIEELVQEAEKIV